MLPPALLDLTLLRVSGPFNTVRGGPGGLRRLGSYDSTRCMHAAALAKPSTPLPIPHHLGSSHNSAHARSGARQKKLFLQKGTLTARTTNTALEPAMELERRVVALQATASAEESSLDPPSYTEEELLGFYQDLLAQPVAEQPSDPDAKGLQAAQAEEDQRVVNAVDQRLQLSPSQSTESDEIPLSETHRERLGLMNGGETQPSPHPYIRVLSRAHIMFSRLDSIQSSLGVAENASSPLIPIGLLTMKECEALVRICLQNQDGIAAESALYLMKRMGLPISTDSVTETMELYADRGNVNGIEHMLGNYLNGDLPTPRQKHLHVKAHIRATPPATVPTSALSVIHSYETSQPAPIQTYTSLITALFSSQASVGRAQGWDLFTHMRYVAHPDPDVVLYTLMIRACASPITTSRSSEPERALDLWHEMTIDHVLEPTVGAYNAVILACARSGTKTYVNEAFRLAKVMLDSNRDAFGRAGFRPNRRTFCALLEGAKRIGDLARARWILAEMVRGRKLGDEEPVELEINEEVMMHMFHAYASYRPPFTRATAMLVTQEKQDSDVKPSSPTPITKPSDTSERHDITRTKARPTFSHVPPQSRSEVIAEASALFARILSIKSEDCTLQALPGDTKFQGVELTTRLLNSYLSVYYKHSSLETAIGLFRALFVDLRIPRDGRTYVEALERCAISRRGHDRVQALQFAEEIWPQWQALEASQGSLLSGRMVERAHVAMIRVLTLTGNLEQAVAQVRRFAETYPPSAISSPSLKPAFRSTRTVLVGQRPLVRMTTTQEVPDDHVPPLLTFTDLDVLHHRLVAAGNMRRDIGYLKYICKAYEWALRVRRDETMTAQPKKIASVV